MLDGMGRRATANIEAWGGWQCTTPRTFSKAW